MDNVDAERKLQNRVLKWLEDDLGYTYIGNLEDTGNHQETKGSRPRASRRTSRPQRKNVTL